MIEFIQQNLLAFYGAVVGTIALLLNIGRFWLMLQRGKRKLRVEAAISDRAQEQLDKLAKSKEPLAQGTLVGPIYEVTIINCSHVHMHIESAGIITRISSGKEKVEVMVRDGDQGWLLSLSKSGGYDLAAGARKKFYVWVDRDMVSLPKVVGCYVKDQLDKEYRGRFISNGVSLTVSQE